MTANRRAPALAIRHLWPLIVVAGVFVLVATHPVRPYDFWWHLRAGQEIAAARAIPTADTFSYTMLGAPYDSYASFWIVELAYYFLHRLGGLPLILLVHTLVITAAYALILSVAFRVSGSLRAASLATLFAMALGLENWNVRPQAVAYLFFAVCLWAIYCYRRQPKRWLLALPPVAIVVWANCHGSYFLGFVLLAIWLADELWNSLWPALQARSTTGTGNAPALARAYIPGLLLLVSALGVLLNPRGPRIFSYIGTISGNAAIRSMVVEWRPPGLDSFSGVAFIAGLLLVAVVFAISPRRPSVFALLTYVAFALLAFTSSRSIVWFGLAMAPVLAEQLAALAARLGALRGHASTMSSARARRPERSGLNYGFAFLILLGATASLPWFKQWLPLPEAKAGLVSTETPVEAVRVLVERGLPREVFHDEGTGSYLTWAAPQYPVFVDPRIELYPEDIWLSYLGVSGAQAGWQERLDSYDAKTLLLSRESQGSLIEAARASNLWTLVWEDAYFVLLTRS